MRNSVMYSFVRSRQLEGTYPGTPEEGVWITTAMRIEKGWGNVLESKWPYDGDADHWPPTEPDGMDAIAKHRRLFAYQRVRGTRDCEVLLAASIPPVIALEIDSAWYQAPHGIIGETCEATSSHSVMLVGYDRDAQQFTFRNSWGAEWGDEGYGYVPYAYIRRYLVDGWFALNIPRPSTRLKTKGIVMQNWGVRSPLGNLLHGVEILDYDADELIGWAFATETRKSFEIEELFVRPDWRRREYGISLASHLRELHKGTKKKLKALIPHPDSEPENSLALDAVVKRLGLPQKDSRKRWIAGLAS